MSIAVTEITNLPSYIYSHYYRVTLTVTVTKLLPLSY